MERVWASRFESVESNLVTIRWVIGLLILIQGAVMTILVFAILGRPELSPNPLVSSASGLERPVSGESPSEPGGQPDLASPGDDTSSHWDREEN